MVEDLNLIIKALEDKKHITNKGIEYWMGRDIQEILGYSDWRNFQNVVDKARMACESAGKHPDNHFVDTTQKVLVGSNALVPRSNYYFTRYACYLISMNGDTSKSEVGTAQSYFAYQTRRQELEDLRTDDERRILHRCPKVSYISGCRLSWAL